MEPRASCLQGKYTLPTKLTTQPDINSIFFLQTIMLTSIIKPFKWVREICKEFSRNRKKLFSIFRASMYMMEQTLSCLPGSRSDSGSLSRRFCLTGGKPTYSPSANSCHANYQRTDFQSLSSLTKLFPFNCILFVG